uniref:uncharacterized protein LOC120344790 n=1 Tax=Styela clava TaxID=7725 RepID=UPI001939E7D0|nr:uncharacterized protein LOC120344790 [Styela clava]
MAHNTDSGYVKLDSAAPGTEATATNIQPQQQPDGATQSQVTAPAPQPETTTPAQIKPRITHKNVLFKLGIAEVIFGVLSCILCIITLILADKNSSYLYYDDYEKRYYQNRITYGSNVVAQGIWCGVVILASGILGIKARDYPTVCMYRANMTVSIIASFFMFILCILSGVSTITVYPHSYIYILLPYHTILAIIGFVGMIICIVHSAYCCAGICCRTKTTRVPRPAYSRQQMVRLANGQYMMVPINAPQNYPGMPIAQQAVVVPPGQVFPQPVTGVQPYPSMPGQGPQYYPPGQMPSQPAIVIPAGQMPPNQPPPMYSQSQPGVPAFTTQIQPNAPCPTMPQQVTQPLNPSTYPRQPPCNPSV